MLTPHLETNVAPKSMLEQEREVLNSLPLPAVIIDSKGTIQAFNHSASKEFGYALTEVLGKNINLLMTGTERGKQTNLLNEILIANSENHNSYLEQYLKTGKAKIIGIGREVTAKAKDGSLMRCKLWITEKIDGERRFFSGVLDPNPGNK